MTQSVVGATGVLDDVALDPAFWGWTAWGGTSPAAGCGLESTPSGAIMKAMATEVRGASMYLRSTEHDC
jgi:hypothetical protein